MKPRPCERTNCLIYVFTSFCLLLSTEHYVAIKECDQVHIEDVASDDTGQDLRYTGDLLFHPSAYRLQ